MEIKVTRAEPVPIGRKERFPAVPLFAALGFVVFAFLAVLFGQVTGLGTVRMEIGNPVAVRDIVLIKEDAVDLVKVKDYASGDELAAYGQNEGGFVRGAFRGLSRIRLVANVPETQPFRLIRWSSGAVSLSDTGTGERLYLDAYGRDNVAAFAQFLEGQGGT